MIFLIIFLEMKDKIVQAIFDTVSTISTNASFDQVKQSLSDGLRGAGYDASNHGESIDAEIIKYGKDPSYADIVKALQDIKTNGLAAAVTVDTNPEGDQVDINQFLYECKDKDSLPEDYCLNAAHYLKFLFENSQRSDKYSKDVINSISHKDCRENVYHGKMVAVEMYFEATKSEYHQDIRPMVVLNLIMHLFESEILDVLKFTPFAISISRIGM